MKKGKIEKYIRESILREADANGDDAIYVSPDKGKGNESMSSAIDKTVQNNKYSGENDYVVDPKKFEDSPKKDNITIDINADNGADAQNQIRQKMQNPSIRNMVNKGQVQTNVHIGESIHFTRGEMDKFLMTL